MQGRFDASEFEGVDSAENCALPRRLDNLVFSGTLDSHHWFLPLPRDLPPPLFFEPALDGRPAVHMLAPWSRLKQSSHW